MTDDLYSKLTSQLGGERYESASRHAKLRAPGLGTGLDATYNEDDEQAFAVVDDMADLIVGAVADTDGQVEMLLRLYEECPTYWATTRLREVLKNRVSGSAAHERFWDAVVRYLGSGDPVFADPMWYSMWVDWFEDQATSQAAWGRLAAAATNESLLRGLIESSGPVPWSAKLGMLERAAGSAALHDAVADAIIRAAGEYFGQLDIDGAVRLAEGLTLPDDKRAQLDQVLRSVRLVDRAPGEQTVMEAVRYEAVRGTEATGDGAPVEGTGRSGFWRRLRRRNE